MIVQLIPNQRGLELGTKEPVPVPAVAKHHEMEGEDGHVDSDWPDDETQDPSKEMLRNHSLQ